jgi:DNA excision repair protein ERCC-2
MIPYAETIICDYNYVFSPSAAVNRLSKPSLGETEKPNLIIDEAHNLPSRAMEYYSPGLCTAFFERLVIAIESIPLSFHTEFKQLVSDCIHIIKNHGIKGKLTPHTVKFEVKIFLDQEALLSQFLTKYLEEDIEITPDDIVLNLFNYWSEFTSVLQWLDADQPEFIFSYYPQAEELKITCCDASELLRPKYDEFKQVVAFSATLKPFDYYTHLTGLQSDKLKTEEFVSPFPDANRKIIVIPQVSSRYTARNKNFPRIADAIHKIAALKQGNYFAFFPSFTFLEKVLAEFTPVTGMQTITQRRNMSQKEVNHLLNKLAEENSANIVFAVQGGLLSEGIDYPGNLAIGAFIVGAPLPNYNWEREKLKEYYQQRYAAGTDYAYTYPAIAKAVQSAGRIIRSETDKGIIILMDDRYLQTAFNKCMPADWFSADVSELVSQSILNDVNQFWNTE